jgi:pilus assembly protein CpaE
MKTAPLSRRARARSHGAPQGSTDAIRQGGPHAVVRGPSVLAVHGAAGGVGATRLAAEIATFLAAHGDRVAAIDADVDRGCLHYRLDVPAGRGTFSLADVVDVLEDISEEALTNALARSPSGACLLPAPPLTRRPASLDPATAARLVGALRSSFDRVIIDTRSAFDGFTAGLLASADTVLLVATPELGCLGGARRAIGSLSSLAGGGPEVLLVLNRSLGSSDIVAGDELETLLGIKALKVLPEDGARCRRLANECRPLSSERSVLSREVDSMVRCVFPA